jgi:hypothetical protein
MNNLIDTLNTLPAVILLIIQELLKESARTGKTPEQLLEEAGLQIAANEVKAADLLAKLKA